ncbi:MAG: hypothetical protein CVU38_06615 [Chloroflexi bacterium HGW-Chloroflexi-1]|nr:MAG: hypothetical protein CVU38_06615 [Chloroflexi bacterium HGW-Chloroflexi-1]
MSLIQEPSVGKYANRMKGLFYTHLEPIAVSTKGPTSTPARDQTILEYGVTFCDNSILRGMETLIEEGGRVEAIRYGYEYQRPSGFFFFYEMEQTPQPPGDKDSPIDAATQIRKPYCHLHVGAQKESIDRLEGFPPELRKHDGPHYGTFRVSLDYVLAVIVVNYFPEHKAVLSALNLGDFLDRTRTQFPTAYHLI